MTAKSICENALKELGSFNIPATFVGSSLADSKLAIAQLRRVGNTLAREHDWSSLITTYTFNTVAGQSDYDLPTGFRGFADGSQWDRTNQWPLTGPTSPRMWQALNSGVVQATTFKNFRIAGGKLHLFPTPTAVETMAFDYYSTAWIVQQSTGDFVTEFEADQDTVRLDENLLELGVKWRFLSEKGFPYDEQEDDFNRALSAALANDGGKGVINMGGSQRPATNLPETGFGS